MRQAWQCRLLVGALLALAPSLVEAAGFQLRENDAAGLGTAFAGTGSAADTPATVFDNPAGMVQLPGVQVQLGGSIAVPSFVFHGGARDAFGRPIAGQTIATAATRRSSRTGSSRRPSTRACPSAWR